MMTSTEWLTIGTAFIGIAGTLAGSVITYTLANKQERKRWLQEKEDRTQTWERENALRFHGEKRIIYSEYLGKMYMWHSQMTSQLHEEYGGQAYGPDGDFAKFEAEITTLRAQLDLIAPHQVRTSAEILWGAGAAIALTLALPDRYSKERREKNVSDFTRYLSECRNLMRDDVNKSGQGLTVAPVGDRSRSTPKSE
jgi:hypothetical protein